MTGEEETLSDEVERLRAILMQLEFAPVGDRHHELLARVRVATAAVRTARAALAVSRSQEADARARQALTRASDYAVAST